MKRLFAMITALMLLTAVKAQDAAETPALSELMLISQPVMQLKSGLSRDYLTFYFDVKNIGVEKYKGEIMLIFEPDFEHFYAKEKIKVSSGKTRRVTFDVDVNKIYYDSVYNVVPVYCYENQWYQLTNYEAFDSLFVCLAHPDLQSVVDAAPCYVTNYYYIERPPRPLFYHFGAWYWGGYYDYYGGGYHYHYHYHTHIHYNDNPQTPPSEPAEPTEPTEPVPPVTPAEPVTPSPFHDRLDEIWSKIKKEKGQSPANPYYNSRSTVTPAPIPTRTTNNGSYLTTPADSKKTTTNGSTTTNTKPTTPTMPKYNNSTTFTTPASTSNKNTVTPATPAKPSTPTMPAKPTTPQWSSPSPAPTTTHKNTVTPAAPSKPTPAPTPAPRPTVTPNNSSSQKTNSGNVTPSKPSTPPTPSHNNSSSSKPAKSSRK